MSSLDKNIAKKIPHIKEDECIGCILCTQICPKVYEMQDDSKSHVTDPSGDSEEKIQESIDACPVSSIEWKEEKKG
ncbi:MAG: ferredoxin [Nitrospirota bacterium]